MSRVKSFIGLDFMTLKPYLKLSHLLLFFIAAEYLIVFFKSYIMALSFFMFIAIMYTTYPFAVGEKTNMDALYPTLSVNRKNVVSGRYLFTIAFDILCILFTFVFGVIGKVIRLLWKGNSDIASMFDLTAAIVLTFFIVQLIQLPIYFKFGYTKSKLFTTITFGMFTYIFVSYLLQFNLEGVGKIIDFSENNKTIFIFIVIAVTLILTFISYSLSVKFYKKRDF